MSDTAQCCECDSTVESGDVVRCEAGKVCVVCFESHSRAADRAAAEAKTPHTPHDPYEAEAF